MSESAQMTEKKKSRTRRRPQLKELKPSESPLWRYNCSDGAIAIYTPQRVDKSITYERALWLLERARVDLMKQFEGS